MFVPMLNVRIMYVDMRYVLMFMYMGVFLS